MKNQNRVNPWRPSPNFTRVDHKSRNPTSLVNHWIRCCLSNRWHVRFRERRFQEEETSHRYLTVDLNYRNTRGGCCCTSGSERCWLRPICNKDISERWRWFFNVFQLFFSGGRLEFWCSRNTKPESGLHVNGWNQGSAAHWSNYLSLQLSEHLLHNLQLCWLPDDQHSAKSVERIVVSSSLTTEASG